MTNVLLLLSAFIFHVVPAYLTYKAAIAPTPESTRKWLAFWCVHTLFACAELALDALAAHALAYGAAKAAVFSWLVFMDGAGAIYSGGLGEALRARSGDIDTAMARLQAALGACCQRLLSSGLQSFQPQQLLSAGLWAASAASQQGGAQQAQAAAAALLSGGSGGSGSGGGAGAGGGGGSSNGAGAVPGAAGRAPQPRAPAAAAHVSVRRRGGGAGGQGGAPGAVPSSSSSDEE